MITAVPGIRVGHWTDPVARTGCTVVLFPAPTVASGEVRGGAPGTREWGLLAPERTVARVDAVVLSGGSAFGNANRDDARQRQSRCHLATIFGRSVTSRLLTTGFARPDLSLSSHDVVVAGPGFAESRSSKV